MTLPERWAETRLDVVCDINPPLSINERPSIDTVVSFVPMSAVDETSGTIARPETRPYIEVAKGYTSFKPRDLLFAKVTPCMENGKAAIANRLESDLGFGSTEFHILRPGPLVLPEYLLQFVRQPIFRRQAASAFVGTGGLRRVPQDFLARTKIPLPTLPEQRRIVDIFQQAEALGTNRSDTQAVIESIIREQFAAVFGDIFGNDRSWPLVKLGRVATIVRGSSPRPQGDARYFGGSVPRLMVSDLTRDGLWVDAITDSLTEEGATMSRPMLAQSVVIAVSGAPGLAAILNHDACIHDGFVGLRDLDATLLPEFVAYSLNLLRARSDQQAVGAVFRNLTTDQVKAINIPHPPIELQTEFKLFLLQVKALELDIAASSRLLDKLMDTIRIESFSGNLTAPWRDKHESEIVEAAGSRDAILHERGARVVRIEEHAPPERAPIPDRSTRRWVVNQLSDFQGFVLTALHEFKGTLLPDDAQALDSFCRLWPMEHVMRPHDRVRRVLDQLAELGLIAKVTVQNGIGEFVTGYRSLRSEEETRLQDAGRLQALLRKQSTKTPGSLAEGER